jgi:hypothetical protein
MIQTLLTRSEEGGDLEWRKGENDGKGRRRERVGVTFNL